LLIFVLKLRQINTFKEINTFIENALMKFKLFFISLLLSINISAESKEPVLSFFNEMKGADLEVFFRDSSIITTLSQLNAEIRMGILDLTNERASVLKKLNAAGVPVVAWLLLPEKDGYFFHSGNGELAIKRYLAIKKWADEKGIFFAGIGLDLELDMNDIKLAKSDKWKLIRSLPARLYDKTQIEHGLKTYHRLLKIIEDDGYPIESYYASFIKDEIKNGTTSIQQLTKFLDVKVDKEIPMLYTSFMGNPYGIIKVYGIDENLKYMALGSTGGGIDTSMNSMNWEELAHDIRLASKTAEEIHIFSLEGAVWKGYFKNLIGFDYNVPIAEKPEQVKSVESIRNKVMMASTILSYPTILFIGIIFIITLLFYFLFRIIKLIINRI
jgi:hypothetical protein